jgi:hypothetical protein
MADELVRPCQRCSEPFDWTEATCPHCGWDRAAWVAGGRYGLTTGGHGEPEGDRSGGGPGELLGV